MARLKDTYAKEVAPALMKKFNYKSVMQIPKLDKVVINVGCGEARDNPKVMDAILSDLAKITGQKPVVCKAKKSPSRTSSCARACPSARRSPCAATACTNSWTASSAWLCPVCATSAASTPTPSTAAATTACGVKEQLIFPEIDYDKIDAVRGMDICFVTTAKTDEEAKELLNAAGRSVCELREGMRLWLRQA